MRPDELAARSRRQAAENDDVVLRVLVRAGDAGLRPGLELADLAGLAPRTASEVVGRLVARGLAKRDGKRRVWPTVAGQVEAGAGMPGVSLLPALDSAVACFPVEGLRATVRLQLAAVVARWHLAGEYPTGWGGFVAGGPTKTAKTSVAQFVCRVYGLDERRVIRVLQDETPGTILGRRLRDSDSPTGFRLGSPPLLDLCYVTLDEFEKAPPDVKAAAGLLLLGSTTAEHEGELRTIRPLVYVTLNSARDGLRELHAAHVRRSVVVDTGPLRPLLIDVDLDMAQLFDGSGRIPRLSLEQLKPPLTALPPDLWRLLRDELRAGLTEDGWALSDTEPLARIALGYAALTRGDPEQAVLAVAFNALSCASTLGHTVAGYIDRLGPRLAGGALLPDAGGAEEQQRQLATLRRSRELERARDRHRLVEERGRLEQMLDEVLARLDLRRLQDCSADQRVTARGLAEVLRDTRGNVTAARTWQALSDAQEQARDPVLRAGELLRQIDRERQTRHEIRAQAAATQRTRKPELQAARRAVQLLVDMLPNATGAALDALEQQAKQLDQRLHIAPPVSEEQRRRDIEALALKQVHNARLLEGI
jgi:hypothetical protein